MDNFKDGIIVRETMSRGVEAMRPAWTGIVRALTWLWTALLTGLSCAILALIAALVLGLSDVPAPWANLRGDEPRVINDAPAWVSIVSYGTYISMVAALLFVAKDFGKGVIALRRGETDEAVLRLTMSAIGTLLIVVIPLYVWTDDRQCPQDWEQCSSADGIDNRCFASCLSQAVDRMTALTSDAIIKDRRRATLARAVSSTLLFENAATSRALLERGRTSDGRLDFAALGCEGVFRRGITLREDHGDQLRRAVRALKNACPNSERITVRVASSSSPAPFKGWPEADSDSLNTVAANCRGQSVEGKLRDILRQEGMAAVQISREVWASQAAIERPAFSGVEYHALQDLGFQSRSVVVTSETTAACFD